MGRSGLDFCPDNLVSKRIFSCVRGGECGSLYGMLTDDDIDSLVEIVKHIRTGMDVLKVIANSYLELLVELQELLEKEKSSSCDTDKPEGGQ